MTIIHNDTTVMMNRLIFIFNFSLFSPVRFMTSLCFTKLLTRSDHFNCLYLDVYACTQWWDLRRLATSVSHLVGYLIIYSAFTFEPNILGILCLLLAIPASLIAFSFTCLNSKDDKKLVTWLNGQKLNISTIE